MRISDWSSDVCSSDLKIVLSVMATAQSMDKSLAEAAHSLGAGSWAVMRDVTLPALAPALIASGAICFAISIGAFGTAFTLATDINVLPMTIYTEFTQIGRASCRERVCQYV